MLTGNALLSKVNELQAQDAKMSDLRYDFDFEDGFVFFKNF
jgi:hypothetical protein